MPCTPPRAGLLAVGDLVSASAERARAPASLSAVISGRHTARQVRRPRAALREAATLRGTAGPPFGPADAAGGDSDAVGHSPAA